MSSNPERAFETPARSRYGACWTVVATLVGVLALVSGVLTIGWAAVVATTLCVAVLGGAFGVAWVEDPAARRGAAIRGAWYGAGGALVVSGLPAVIAGWAILVLIVLGASAPPVVDAVVVSLGRRRAEQQADDLGRLSDSDLARLWRTTYDAVSRPTASAPQRLAVAQQRARLLDELERRDPRRFRSWMAATARTRPSSSRPQPR